MTARKVAILFDIDGTLITSGGAGTKAWSLAYQREYKIEVDISVISDMGMTDPEVGELSFVSAMGRKPNADELARLLELHTHFLPISVAQSEKYRVLDGAEEILISLIQQGYILGLSSGNSEKGAHIKLHRAGLNRFFSFGGYGSDSRDRGELTKVAMSRAQVVYGAAIEASQFLAVGDTSRDVEAAHTAGIACVAVASAKFSEDELAKSGADFVISSLKDGLPL